MLSIGHYLILMSLILTTNMTHRESRGQIPEYDQSDPMIPQSMNGVPRSRLFQNIYYDKSLLLFYA